MTNQCDDSESSSRQPFYLLALIVLTLIAYLPVLQCSYIWDDDYYVTRNATLRTLDGLGDIWFSPRSIPQYYPIVHSTFWVEYHLWGLQPLGYHIINVLLHIGSCLLLWRLLRRLGMDDKWAWLASAIFALHPVQVESVAWITERKNVLSCLFYLSAANVYLYFDQSRKFRHWLYALGLFVLALLSKTVVLTLPAAMLVILWQQRGRLRFKSDILPTVPFLIIGAGLGLLTAWLEKTHVGATGHEWTHDALQRFLLAGRVVSFYAGKLLLPMNLSFVYPRWEVSVATWWQWLFPVGVLTVLLGSVLYGNKTGRRFVPACLLCFTGTLLPALGFFDVFPFRYSFVADHFQYHASIGFCVLMAVTMSVLLRKFNWATWLILLVYVGLTMMQTMHYTNAESLWRATIKTNPDAWLARNNLALILRQRGEIDAVKELMQEAIKRTPDAIEPRLNMGQLMMELGKPRQAIEHYDVVLELIPEDRRALLDKAIALEHLEQFADAKVYFTKAARVYELLPQHLHTEQGWMYYARSLEGAGQLAQAVDAYQRGVKDYPGTAAQAYQRLGLIAQKQGDSLKAIAFFQASAKLGQGASVESIYHWSWILATHPETQLRDGAKAVKLAMQICQHTQNRAPRYLDALAAAFAEVGQYDQAIAIATEAKRLANHADFQDLTWQITQRIKLYQTHQPYRDRDTHLK